MRFRKGLLLGHNAVRGDDCGSGSESGHGKSKAENAMCISYVCTHHMFSRILNIHFCNCFFEIFLFDKNNIYIMAVPVVEFLREGYKIRKCFGSKLTVVK